jgi:two-component system NtrC family response regulator
MSVSERSLLVVDDDAGLRKQLRWTFSEYTVHQAEDRRSAVATHAKMRTPVVLLDLGMPPDTDGASEGMGALQELLAAEPHTKVIVMTGQRERAYALKAIALGAYDFYEKPVDQDALALIVDRAFNLAVLEAENRALQSSASETIAGVLTCNAAMKAACQQVSRFARADLSVLIVGESGTGKELLAKGLHALSGPSRSGPYIALNCAAIPENLLESELFGYEKGAFTGAHKTTPGRIEQADKGTLLLDEIGDLSLPLQAKLLRVLQERVVERVGGRRSIPFDTRVVAATHRDLAAMVQDGSFREDLYYRIAEAVITIPPLRARPEDIVLIAQHFLSDWCSQQALSKRSFAADALEALANYPWPGNVRELQSRIKRAAVTADGAVTAADLGFDAPEAIDVESLKVTRGRAEREAVRRALAKAEGNISVAARMLDVSRPTLYQLMREQGLR